MKSTQTKRMQMARTRALALRTIGDQELALAMGGVTSFGSTGVYVRPTVVQP